MRIQINGQVCDVPSGLTVTTLLQHLELNNGPVAIERNLEIVPRTQHSITFVQEGDVFEIVNFVGGG